MSEHITRVSLDEALDADRTDWARLASVSDADLDAAIEADTDTFALAEDSANLRWLVFQDGVGKTWRWRLTDATGEAIAESPKNYRLRSEADRAIAVLQRVLRAA